MGAGDLRVGAVALGCMGFGAPSSSSTPDECVSAVHAALELGLTMFDTAEIYGPHRSEEILGRALKDRRDDAIIATKTGLDHRIADGHSTLVADGRPERVRHAIEGSLRRLGVEYVDLYYLHRPDTSVPIEESIGAMADLVDQGKVRHVGISEASASTLRRAYATHPIVALQSEYSLWSRDLEDDILETCRELGVGLVAYGPLGRGFFTGTIKGRNDLKPTDNRRSKPRFSADALAMNQRLVVRLRQIADELDASPGQVALAWVLAQGDDIVPLAGSTKPAHIEENAKAVEVVLPADTLAELDSIRVSQPRSADPGWVNRSTPPAH